MQYLWKIIFISDIQTVGQNWLQKRTVVLEEVNDKDYKWGIAFDLIKDKVSLIDGFTVWDTVEVLLNFRATESNGRWFTNINAWSIKKVKWDSVDVDIDDIMPF